MKKTCKKLLGGALAVAAVMTMSLTAFAASTVAWDDFSATLPKNQGDTEVSTVARSNSASTEKNFTVNITSMPSGYTAVRAWTEKPAGANYSNPYKQIGSGESDVSYSTTPAQGKNVVLNLDNPVKTTKTPTVKGKWTPN